MSERPISDRWLTETELTALRELGYDWFTTYNHDTNIAEAYRAGFRDGGSKSPATRVFLPGDPEPGPEVTAVVDEDGDSWKRQNGASWSLDSLTALPWDELVDYGPLVAGLPVNPMSDYDAAIKADAERRSAIWADAERRAAEQATGGAR